MIRRIGFLLIDGYAMLSTAAALDPLRAANSFAGRTLYEITLLTPEGHVATSSLGGRFDAVPLAQAGMEFWSDPLTDSAGRRMIYGRDPDGNVVELIQPPS